MLTLALAMTLAQGPGTVATLRVIGSPRDLLDRDTVTLTTPTAGAVTLTWFEAGNAWCSIPVGNTTWRLQVWPTQTAPGNPIVPMAIVSEWQGTQLVRSVAYTGGTFAPPALTFPGYFVGP